MLAEITHSDPKTFSNAIIVLTDLENFPIVCVIPTKQALVADPGSVVFVGYAKQRFVSFVTLAKECDQPSEYAVVPNNLSVSCCCGQGRNRGKRDVTTCDTYGKKCPCFQGSPDHTGRNEWTRVGRNRKSLFDRRARDKDSDVVLIHDSLGHIISEGIMSKEGLRTNKILGYTLEETYDNVTHLEHEPQALVIHWGTNNIKNGDSVNAIVDKYA